MKTTVTASILVFVLSCCLFAPAAEPRDPQAPLHVEYSVNLMTAKLQRGVLNIFTGVGEFSRQRHLEENRHGDNADPNRAFLNGLLMTPVRMGVGLLETLTFPIPTTPVRRAPAGMSYQPLLKPAYVWEKE